MYDENELHEFFENMKFWIRDQFKFWRTYTAKVKVIKDDTDMKGQVGLECLELLAKDPKTYIWALPVGGARAAVMPKIGDIGTLFFRDADPEQARFISDPPTGMFTAEAEQKIMTIFESEKTASYAKFSEEDGFSIESKTEAAKDSKIGAMVLGDMLKTALDGILDGFITDLYTQLDTLAKEVTNHMHPTTAPGAPTGPPMPPMAVNVPMINANIGAKKSEVGTFKSDYAKPGKLLSTVNKNN